MSLRRRKIEPEAEYRCDGERWNRRAIVVAAGQAATPAAFYLGLCRLRGNLSPPAPATVILQAGNSSMRLRMLQAGHSILRQQSSAGGLFYLPRRLLQAELQYFATKKIGIGRGTVAATPAQASYSTCRHDGVASILDFKPRVANRCSKEIKSGATRASILDFKPRLANRCSQKVKTGAIRASILDFRSRLANRCSQKVKTGAIRASILDFRPRLSNRCSQKVKARAIRASILDFKPRLANRCSKEVKTMAIPAAQGRVGRGDISNPAGRADRGDSSCPQAESPPHHTKSPDSFLNRDP